MLLEQPWATGPFDGLLHVLRKHVAAEDFDHADLGLPIKDGSALADMNNCRMTKPLREAFGYIQTYEQTDDLKERQGHAFKGALASLRHEQELHLQRMIYDRPEFRDAMDKNDLARAIPGLGWLLGATDPTLFFHAEASVDSEIYERDVAPYGIAREDITARMAPCDGHLYNVNARMRYVKQILMKYHKLMTQGTDPTGQYSHREYMVGQMRVIARWCDA